MIQTEKPPVAAARATGSSDARCIDVENLTTIVIDHEEAVEHAEPEGWNGEEVHRRDGYRSLLMECNAVSC
jgi:hypothetical protein